MKNLENLHERLDDIWERYTSRTDFDNPSDTSITLKKLIGKIKELDKDFLLIRKQKTINKKHLKALRSLAAKRIEVCKYLVGKFDNNQEVNALEFDNLMGEMKEKENDLFVVMSRG